VIVQLWLATSDALISCRSGEMTISNGTHSQKLVLFLPSQPATEVTIWMENPYGEKNYSRLLLTLQQAKGVQEKTEEHILSLFLTNAECIEYPQYFPEFTHIFILEFHEVWHISTSTLFTISTISEEENSNF
jgi:hypothetical protein